MTVDEFPDREVEEKLRRKIAEGSQDPDDYRNLSDLLFPSGGYDEAIVLYQRALVFSLTAFKKAQLLMELGWIYYNTGQRVKVTPLAQEALSLLSTESKNAEVLYCMGASQALLALNEFPRDPNATTEAARLALDWLEKAIADGSDFRDKPHAYIDAALIHSMLGNVDKAIAHCETCLNREIDDSQRIPCLIIYSQALQQEERFAEAEQVITQAFQYGKNYKAGLFQRLYTERGKILRFTNRLAESKASLEQALAALKSDPYFHSDAEILGEIYFNLATVCYELGEFENAISGYSNVLHYHAKDVPAYWTALYWLGRSYEATEDHPRARDCYSEVLASPRASEDDKALAQEQLLWVLAKLYYESGKYMEAAAAFEEVVSHYTEANLNYWPAILWLGSSYEGLEAYGKARTFYEQVLDSSHTMDADKVIAQKGLARTLARLAYESADYREAAVKFEEVLGQYPETDPNHWNTSIWLASCYQGLENYAKAQECYQRVLGSRHSTDHDKVFARKRLTSTMGKAYCESRNYPEAIAAFEELLTSCLENDPDRFHAMVWLGYSCHAMGMRARARDCFERVLASPHALEADKTSARNGLARLQSI